MQKTFSIKAGEITHKWYIIDAKGKVLGRMASDIARILQGKHKPEYTPHMDTGDNVIVINAIDVELSGKKKDIKLYRHHTGYIGGLKEIPFRRMQAKHPEEIIRHAVQGMMPKTKLGNKMLSKLKVYAGSKHEHSAQKPEILEL